jgi:hypothetical protein
MVMTVTVGPPIEISGLALDYDRTSVSVNGREGAMRTLEAEVHDTRQGRKKALAGQPRAVSTLA